MTLDDAALAFSALSLPVRIKIFQILAAAHQQGATPTAIASALNDMPRNTLSFHLRQLQNAGLCYQQRRGKHILYFPKSCHLQAVAEFLIQNSCHQTNS